MYLSALLSLVEISKRYVLLCSEVSFWSKLGETFMLKLLVTIFVFYFQKLSFTHIFMYVILKMLVLFIDICFCFVCLSQSIQKFRQPSCILIVSLTLYQSALNVLLRL